MKKIRKQFCLLMAMFLVLGMLPVSVFAADYKTDQIVNIAGVEMMDLTEVTYYLNDGNGSLTTEGASAENYNLKYEPINTENKCVVTLKDVNLTQTFDMKSGTNWTGAPIGHQVTLFFHKADVEFVLEGDNFIGCKDGGDYRYNHDCICSINGNITFSGDGDLTCKSADFTSDQWCDCRGLNAKCNDYIQRKLVFNGTGTLKFLAGKSTYSSMGIYVNHLDVEVNGGDIYAIGDDATSDIRATYPGEWFQTSSVGITIYNASYTQNGGRFTAESGDVLALQGTGIYSYGFNIEESTLNDGILISRCGKASNTIKQDKNGKDYEEYVGAYCSYAAVGKELMLNSYYKPGCWYGMLLSDGTDPSAGIVDTATAMVASNEGNVTQILDPKDSTSDFYDEDGYIIGPGVDFMMAAPLPVTYKTEHYTVNGGVEILAESQEGLRADFIEMVGAWPKTDYLANVTAEPLELEGYVVDKTYTGTLDQSAPSKDDSTILKLFYLPNYNVIYQYEGDVPSGAPPVPVKEIYRGGDHVVVADAPAVDGYTFSGWTSTDAAISEGSFTMPEKNVVLSGYFTRIPAPEPDDPDPEPDDPDPIPDEPKPIPDIPVPDKPVPVIDKTDRDNPPTGAESLTTCGNELVIALLSLFGGMTVCRKKSSGKHK